jgi:hypothetical protein
MRELCTKILQRCAMPSASIVVSSGWQPAAEQVHRWPLRSQHMEGRAVDVVCFSLDTKQLFKRVLELKLPFDQLIYEGGRESVWVHVSFDAKRARREIMTATFPDAGGVLYKKISRRSAMKL